MGTQLNFDELLNKKSGYGPTLDEYLKGYIKENKELPSYRALKAAGFGDTKHNLRVILEQKAKTLQLPIPADFEDNYSPEKNNYESNYSAGESNYEVPKDPNIVKFCKILYNILQNYSKRHIFLLRLLSDGSPKSVKSLTLELSISRPTLYSWVKILQEHISIKKVTIKADGPGRPQTGFVLDLDENNIVKFCKALYNILQNSETEFLITNSNGVTAFEDWITLPFKVPDEWKPILTLIVGTSIAEQHVQVKEQLHGLSIKNTLISAYHQAVADLKNKISDIDQVNGHHFFELCGGVPAAFFDKYLMHETLGCVGDLEGKIEEVADHIYLRKRRL
jgi:hypothetical protein